MLGIHWPEFMLIAVVTVLVVGPKELPRVLRTITRMMRKIQGLSKEFQNTMNDLAKEADLDDMKKDFTEIESRVADMRVEDELEKTLDGDNKIAGMFTGDVIGTELAQEANKEKPAEVKDDLEEQMDSEIVEKIESNSAPQIEGKSDDAKGGEDDDGMDASTAGVSTPKPPDKNDAAEAEGPETSNDDDGDSHDKAEKAAAPGSLGGNKSAPPPAGA